MKKFLSRIDAARERGAVMFLVAGTVIVVLLMGAVAVDLSSVANRGQDLQNAADAAALAGVQAYRASDGDEAAAWAAVNDILNQNNIENVDVNVTFPGENQTDVEVTITDENVDTYIAGVTGAVSDVERTATAQFESCEDTCFKEVEIPPPFKAVDATGDGDGYKPIPVGDKLYAINHNATTRQIVCIDRATEETCWNTAGRVAYAGNAPPRNPEMPNTAVVDTRIFWSATTSNGQYLYCWETVTDTPCSYQHRLNSRPRIDVNPSRTENRGGGTIALNNQIYVFTDDHRVHCIRPDSFSTCSGFGANGLPTALGSGHANFPWADGYNRNHGSSIDRIVDEDTGYIYSTLHIDSIERGPNNIQPPPVCDDPGLGNREDPTGIITIKNVSTASANIYVRLNPTDPEHVMDFVADPNNPPDLYTRWEVVRAEAPDHTDVDPRYVYAFRNVGYWEEQGASMFLNVELPDAEGIIGLGSEFTTNPTIDQLYRLEYQGTSSRMRSFGYDTFDDNYIRDDGGEYVMADYVNQTADWIFEPWQCSWNGPQGLQFSVGTFLHCFDTINAAPCSDFKPSKIHDDSDSFSGRPFFYYGGGNNPAKLGICSTGFTEQWSWRDMRGLTQMTCVDMQGEDAPGFENAMSTFTSALNSTNFQGWGTWGDPHYSEHANRILYPTQRAKSRVLCYDFDTASYCGAREGVSALGYVQDYGFFSQGNCVYGLGHNAIFWAFQAENIFEDCTGSSTETTINPCNCSGSLYWGTLNFDVDLELFDSFLIEVYNAEGVRIVPPEDALNDEGDPSEGWSLHDDGTVLDLNGLPVLSEDDELTIEVEVISESDPWAMGDQTFEISFERTPKLTD